MPTGAGKSITYQIPARVLGGTALVISPLIALMKDQVDALTEAGVRATFLNSSVPHEERARRMDAIAAGEIELVYMAPEGLNASAGRVLPQMQLSLVAVDEAHCISHWGHDFRPAYRMLAGLKRRFPKVPVLALTATATEHVVEDIIEQLAMVRPHVFRGSFYRPNLHLYAIKKGGDDKPTRSPPVRRAILDLIRARPGDSGIVYCLSRKSVEATTEFLKENGVRVAAYHAGMLPEDRARSQDAFRDDKVDVVVATIAFGMGIDKDNVRYVIHRDMPRSIEGYYQEVGRAGRDGLPSDCVLFYSWAEVMAYDRFAEEGSDEIAGRVAAQARAMFRFAEGAGCRHQALVGHFGEDLAPCGSSCDACGAPPLATSPAKATRTASAPAVAAGGRERELFDLLKMLRRHIAETRGVPAYVVFNDATLLAMAKAHPKTQAALRQVPGVGPKKLEAYGEAFLKLLREEG
jgi:ATP-dependent DNA helicase RecQ